MRRFAIICGLTLSLGLVNAGWADERPHLNGGNAETGHGAPINIFDKATRDTVVLIGPASQSPLVVGTFQNLAGTRMDWHGWTSVDLTAPEDNHWQTSYFMADELGGGLPFSENLAAYCGSDYPACSETDSVGGYGNGWFDILEYASTVSNPVISTNVHFEADINYDCEPGYDYSRIGYNSASSGFVALASFSGKAANVHVSYDFSVSPDDLMGESGNEVHLRILFESDPSWSDMDCLFPTTGAIQIDNVTVSGDNGFVSDTENFESESLGNWVPTPKDPVGDFAKIWPDLEDLDPCASNYSPQVAFIDDGEVVAGVGPTLGVSWTYGPHGYIVNTTGGLLGPAEHLWNAIESPVMAWPAASPDPYSGASYLFDVYRHETLGTGSPGIFYTWAIRSTASADPADIVQSAWEDRNWVYYNGPDYGRAGENSVSDLLVSGPKYIQVQLAVLELGYQWGYDGDDGYPAPYFDNVRLIAYSMAGPATSYHEIYLAQDGFPAAGVLDTLGLGNNHVRFDMALSPAPSSDLNNTAGDSIVLDIVAVRPNSVLVPNELRLYYKIKANPLFDPYRMGFSTEGYVIADTAVSGGNPSLGKWAFDLPDSNFLYPGDVVHYFIQAMDDDGTTQVVSLVPADTTGFSDFSVAAGYNESFVFHALPSMESATLADQVKVLFWDDAGDPESRARWNNAFNQIGFICGTDYDVYFTNGPSSAVGNGLGGRNIATQLSGYETIIYSSGKQGACTISHGDYENDASQDVQLLDAWLRLGEKNLFLTGSELITDLMQADPLTIAFVNDWLGISYQGSDLSTLIGQTSPKVLPIEGTGVFDDLDNIAWRINGGCGSLATFDALDAGGGGVRLAEFTNAAGSGGVYSYSAATLFQDAGHTATIITLPNDLANIYDDLDGAKVTADIAARSKVLRDVLDFFGYSFRPNSVSAVPEVGRFTVHNYPNPFNPATRIEFNLPQAGNLALRIYNLRGELVRTLIDEMQPAGPGHIMWDGTDETGASLSSGVYFYEVRTESESRTRKMLLIK